MRRCREIAIVTMVLLFAIPALSRGGKFMITEVYDGTTVRAEGYDTDCLP